MTQRTSATSHHAGPARPIVAERVLGRPGNGRPRTVVHEYGAMAFCLGGSARFEQAGTWAIGEGDLFIAPAGSAHRLVDAREADLWRLTLCVPCAAATQPALLDVFDHVRRGASPVVRIPAARRAFLAMLLQELSAATAASPDASAVADSLLTLIVREVTAAAGWRAAAAPPRDVVGNSLRFIERHCLEPLTLTRVAAAVSRSPSHVTTALKRATGRSAVTWIISGRMAEARRRLLHSDEPVEAIAAHVGYQDPTHFIRLFRRHHGATPAAWRSGQRRVPGSA